MSQGKLIGRRSVAAAVATGLLIAVAPVSIAGILVDPGGLIRAVAADPVRPVFYASLDTREVVVIEIASSSVTARIPVPGMPGPLAVEPDGSRLYVALTDLHDIGWIDPSIPAFSGTIALSAQLGPSALAPGRPGRLYSTSYDGLSIVDTATLQELWFGVPPGTVFGWNGSDLALSPDGRILYGVSAENPTYLYAEDVSTDVPTYLGQSCCHGCVGGSGRALLVSADGRRLFHANGGMYHLQVLTAEPPFRPLFRIPTGPYPNAIALSEDGKTLYLGHTKPEIVIASTEDLLIRHVVPLAGDVNDDGIALSADGNTLAVIVDSPGFDPLRLELVDLGSPGPLLGGIRMRPIDDSSGYVPFDAEIADASAPGATSNFIESADGVLALESLLPGPHTVEIRSPLHDPVTRTVDVSPGEWADLGDVVLHRTGGLWDPWGICAGPAVASGTTANVEVHGWGFWGPGLLLSSVNPSLTVNSWSLRTSSIIDASMTVAPGTPDGWKAYWLEVTLPDGRSGGGSLLVGPAGAATETVPPAEVLPLLVSRSGDDLVLEWPAVLRDANGDPETMGIYEVHRDIRADFTTSRVWRTDAGTRLVAASAASFGTGSYYFRVRARDAARNLGP